MSKDLIMGVYRIYDKKSGVSYLGYSHHVMGTFKRLRFELTLNANPNKPLQRLWNDTGGLEMELLESVATSETMSDEEVESYLRARMYYWCDKLNQHNRFVQSSVK